MRVADAAANTRCIQLGAEETSVGTFYKALNWLLENGHMDEVTTNYWHEQIRDLRNSSTHARETKLLPPGLASLFLWGMAQCINQLFQGIGIEQK